MFNEQLLYEPRYILADIARWLDMNPRRVSRWLYGYAHDTETNPRKFPAVVHRDSYEPKAVCFLELIELKFIQSFVNAGLSLRTIRAALEEARQIYNLDYPFSRRTFFTDGHAVYIEVMEYDAPHLLKLLSGGQWVMAPIILHTARQIDFEQETKLATRWYPAGREMGVFIDPAFRFGFPCIHGIQTSDIYDLYQAEGKNERQVSDWYRIPQEAVKAAIDFEKKQLGIAL